MRGNLELIIDEDSFEYEYFEKYEISKRLNTDYSIRILSEEKDNYLNLISNYDEIRKCFKESFDNLYGKYDILNDNKDLLKGFLDKEDNFYKSLFNSVEYIKIEGSFNKILNYLNNNSILKKEKIILSNDFDLTINIDDVVKMFKDYDNIYVELDGNDEPIKLIELKKTQKIINDIVEEVNKYQFSVIEKIMFVYDIVREKVYVKEREDESYTESRDLTKVLLGNKIVCVGYAVLFETLLNRLGINNMMYNIKRKDLKIGHALNLVYIKDDKYNIDGIYFFDTTWDSKRKDNDDYLYSYKFFANTKNLIEKYQNYRYVSQTLPYFDNNIVDNFLNEYRTNGLQKMNEDLIKTINRISMLVDKKSLVTPLMKIDNQFLPKELRVEFEIDSSLKKLEEYVEKFNKELRADKLLKILYNVRKIEYYRNSDKYPFNLNVLYSILINSNWEFNSSAEIKLLNAIFGENIEVDKETNMLKFIENNNLDLKIERVKLAKTLKQVYENKKILSE